MQRKGLLLSTVSGLAAFFISTSAFAIMSVPYGWYVEANGGSSHLSKKSYSPGSSSSSGIGGNGNVGYKFMPYMGIEVGYTRYANTNIRNQQSTKAGQDKHYSYDIAVRGILPISDSGFEAFAKLGAQHLNSHVTIKNASAADEIGLTSGGHNATGLYLGLGAQYYFWPELAVVAQWQRAQGTSGTGTLDLYSLGISFIFD